MARSPLLSAGQHDTIVSQVTSASMLRVSGKTVKGADLLIREIATRVSALVPHGIDPLTDTQEIYIQIYADYLVSNLSRRSDSARNSATQSWKSASGNFFQEYVREHINSQVSPSGVVAASAQELRLIDPSEQILIPFLKLPAKRRCLQNAINVWPDNDIIVLTRNQSGAWRAVGIVSCKTSLRERTFESAFWTLATRDTGLRSAFVTADLDDELGTCGDKKGKNRQIAETYFDRAYSTSPNTRHCEQVRPFTEIGKDILRWQQDVVATALTKPIQSPIAPKLRQ